MNKNSLDIYCFVSVSPWNGFLNKKLPLSEKFERYDKKKTTKQQKVCYDRKQQNSRGATHLGYGIAESSAPNL